GPITLVGWSLGGVVARLVAAALPERIEQIITLGTPIEGGPKYTATAELFAKRNGIDLDAFEQHVHRRNSQRLRPPITAIFSKTDGVVGWKAMIDRYNPQTRHRQIPGSHVGLGMNPIALREVAQALAKNARASSRS
ncbi:MAG: hypothetical protein AAF658_13870, partial [Myxococcota bacterium]